MRLLLTIPFIWLAVTLSARAVSVEIPLTLDNLDQQNYTFAVSATASNKETAFHITITAKLENIDSDSQADLRIVKRTQQGGAITGSMEPFKTAVALTLKKEKRVWTADFSVPTKSLKTPGLCFVYTELAHVIADGHRIAMPSATFYEIKLKDFVKE